jgi:hypothetical protein
MRRKSPLCWVTGSKPAKHQTWEQKIYSRLLFNRELVDSQTILAEVDARWGEWKMLAAHCLFEDLFWQRQSGHIPWLEELIRL